MAKSLTQFVGKWTLSVQRLSRERVVPGDRIATVVRTRLAYPWLREFKTECVLRAYVRKFSEEERPVLDGIRVVDLPEAKESKLAL
jgi:hypothetical protein